MMHRGGRENGRPNRFRFWRAGVFFAVLVLVIAAVSWSNGFPSTRSSLVTLLSWSSKRRDTYVGSQACAGCHADEFALHSRSAHATTLRAVTETPLASRLDGLTQSDPELPGVLWTYALRQGQLWVERRASGDVERMRVDYAFGSGRHATSLVTLADRSPNHPGIIEQRLSVFAPGQHLDVTVGQEPDTSRAGIVPFGRQHETPLALKCFNCHATATSDLGPLVLDEQTMIPDVGCERCHGPGRRHVEAARRGVAREFLAMPMGLERFNPGDEMRLCGTCHRLPGNVEPERIAADDPSLVRFEPVGLMQSACYRNSAGTLSCSTCHDPHARVSTDIAAYEGACLLCHQASSRTSCPVSPTKGCIPCHMPRRDVSRGIFMTDHWIRTRGDGNPSDHVNKRSGTPDHLTQRGRERMPVRAVQHDRNGRPWPAETKQAARSTSGVATTRASAPRVRLQPANGAGTTHCPRA